jgi:hypothetical protein
MQQLTFALKLIQVVELGKRSMVIVLLAIQDIIVTPIKKCASLLFCQLAMLMTLIPSKNTALRQKIQSARHALIAPSSVTVYAYLSVISVTHSIRISGTV